VGKTDNIGFAHKKLKRLIKLLLAYMPPANNTQSGHSFYGRFAHKAQGKERS